MTAHNPLDDRESEARFESQLDAIASCPDDEIRGIAYALEICKASVGVPEAPESENKPDPIYAGRFGTLILAVARDPSAVKFTVPRLEEEHISLLHPAEVSRLGEVAIGLMNKPELHGDPQKGIMSWLINAVLNSGPSLMTIRSLHDAAKESGLTGVENLLDVAEKVIDASESFMQAVELNGPDYFKEIREVSTAPEVVPELPASLDLDRTEEAEGHPHMELLEEFEKLFIDYEVNRSVGPLIADLDNSVEILTTIMELSSCHLDPLHPEHIDPEIAQLATIIIEEIYQDLAKQDETRSYFHKPLDQIIQAKISQITSTEDLETFSRKLSQLLTDLPQQYKLRDIDYAEIYFTYMEKRFATKAVQYAKTILQKHQVSPHLTQCQSFASLDFVSGPGYVEFDDFASFSRGMKSVFDFEVPKVHNVDFGQEYEAIQASVRSLLEDIEGLIDVGEPDDYDKTVYSAEIMLPFVDSCADVRVEYSAGKYQVLITNESSYALLAALAENAEKEIHFCGSALVGYVAEAPSYGPVRSLIGETDMQNSPFAENDQVVNTATEIDIARFDLDVMFSHLQAMGIGCEVTKQQFVDQFQPPEPDRKMCDLTVNVSKKNWRVSDRFLKTLATAYYVVEENGVLSKLRLVLPEINFGLSNPSTRNSQVIAAMQALRGFLALGDLTYDSYSIKGNTVDYISGRLDYPR